MQPVQSASQESIDGKSCGNPTKNPTDEGENQEQSTEVDEVEWFEQCGILERYHGKDAIDCRKGDAAGDYAIKNALSDEGRSDGSGMCADQLHCFDDKPTCENGEPDRVVHERKCGEHEEQSKPSKWRHQPLNGRFDLFQQLGLPDYFGNPGNLFHALHRVFQLCSGAPIGLHAQVHDV